MFKHLIPITVLTTALTVAPGTHNKMWLSNKDFKCLVDNIYYEARGESYEGQEMVARVVYNRILRPEYPKDMCKVVYQPYQFSWTMKPQRPPSGPAWETAKLAALSGVNHPTTALFYHAQKIKKKPKWAKVRPFLTKQGKHLFYG